MAYPTEAEIETTLASMSSEELEAGIAQLQDYELRDTLASYTLPGLTPKQMNAWAAFAVTLGAETIISQYGNIQQPVPRAELLRKVARKEWHKQNDV